MVYTPQDEIENPGYKYIPVASLPVSKKSWPEDERERTHDRRGDEPTTTTTTPAAAAAAATGPRGGYSKLSAKPGIEWHVPGYQFLGPGTKLEKRLKRGDFGINRLDRFAKQHDIDYAQARSLKDKHRADRKMIRSIEQLPGKKTITERAIKKIMQTKLGLKL